MPLLRPVILIILWLCQVVFLGDIYRTIKTAEIKNAASELSRIVNDTDRLSEAVETVSRKNDVCILVLKMLSKETAFKLVSCDAVKNCAIHNMSMSGIFTLYDSAVKNGGKCLQHFRYDAASHLYVGIKAGESYGDPRVSFIL